jgi:hypothetical protein
MDQAVSRRDLNAETQVRAQVSPCGICGGQSVTGTSFSRSSSIYHCRHHHSIMAVHDHISPR